VLLSAERAPMNFAKASFVIMPSLFENDLKRVLIAFSSSSVNLCFSLPKFFTMEGRRVPIFQNSRKDWLLSRYGEVLL